MTPYGCALLLLAAGAAGEPAKPMYDPMAVGLVFAGNDPANAGSQSKSVEKAGKTPDLKDMLAGYSYAEINFLDAWAKFIIFQYSLQAYRQWITGETMDSAKSLRDYWFSTSMFVYKGKGEAKSSEEEKKTSNLERLKGNDAAERHLASAVEALREPAPASLLEVSSARKLATPTAALPAAVAAAALHPRAASASRMERLGDSDLESESKSHIITDPMDRLQEIATGQWPGSPEAKTRRKESLVKLAEWLRLMAFQNQLWGSSCLVGAVRHSQVALMIEFQLVGGGSTVEHKFVDDMKPTTTDVAPTVQVTTPRNGWDNLTPWRRYWLSRRMQAEWLTNSAVEVWQGYQIPEAQLALGATLIALNPAMTAWVQQITLADESQMTHAHAIIKRYSLRAEWYAWQCWKTQNGAEYMLAMAVYEERVMKTDPVRGQHVFTKLESAKIYLPGLTQHFIQLGQNWVAAKILLETPLDVVAAVFMWSPKKEEGAPTTPALERQHDLERRRAEETEEQREAKERAKRFLQSTKNAIPWIAMQFGWAVLYRNFVARTLLNAQLKSSMMAKMRSEMLQAQQLQLQLQERARKTQKGQLWAQLNDTAPAANVVELAGQTASATQPPVPAAGLAAPYAGLAGVPGFDQPAFQPPPLGAPTQPNPWMAAAVQQQAQLRQLFSQQAAQRQQQPGRGLFSPFGGAPQAGLRQPMMQPMQPMQPPAVRTQQQAVAAQLPTQQHAPPLQTLVQPPAAQTAAPALEKAPPKKEEQQLAEAELTEQERRELADFLRRKAGETR